MMGGMQNWMLRSVEFCIICLFILVQSASAQNGFVSIACCAETSFSDNNKLNWTSDDEWFPDKKSCHHITSGAGNDRVRVFPIDSGKRCYSLQTNSEQDYLIRATFLSGNNPVSRLGSLFDVLIGVTLIRQVNSSEDFSVEGIFRATRQEIDFCLAHDKGDPFISKLELRPLDDGKYLQGNYSSNVLRLVSRIDAGNAGDDIRYPDDPFDRIWHSPDSGSVYASSPATSGGTSLHNATTTVPLRVLRTALTHTDKLEFLHKDLDMEYHNYTVFLYFLELNHSVQIRQRVFNIYINNEMQRGNFDILAMGSNYREAALNVVANGSLNLTLVKVETGYDLGPILNAYEILQMHSWSQETNQDDVEAMASVRRGLLLHNKENQLLQSWAGDPCHPHSWTGVTCKYRNGSSVITQLDISSSQLQGQIPTSIIELNSLTDLNFSYNGFTSMVPEFFSTSKLTSVDLSNNNLMGILPDSLILLPYLTTLYFGCNPLLSAPSFNSSRLKTDSGECDGKEASNTRGLLIGSIALGSLLLTLAAGIIFSCICGQKFKTRGKKFHGKMAQNAVFSIPSTDADFLKSITIQSFTLEHLESATQQYKTMIGEGGFGSVYRGTLSSGQEVAVKVRSSTSTQGTREFENELNLLSAIRHENLVPLLGYCCEHEQQILVYPFMSNGSLQDRLYGEAAKRKTLDWPTRLSIALGAARGLTYLHTFSGRCVIHRDVKSSNILLDHSMNAKVADFGFSKYAPQEGDSCASLEVRGTAGYLDPEYYSTQHLSVKSDVFSFGVVLLEIVSGREPLNVSRPRNEWSLVEWAKPYIRESRIDEIVDPNIKGAYHAEAMWRVVEVASTCIETFSAYRPFMPDIVRELEDALIIENNASEYMKSIDSLGGYSLGGSNRFSIVMDKRITLPPPAPSPPEPSPINTKALAPPEPR